jgi:biotin/methionine sulfoxide reductase
MSDAENTVAPEAGPWRMHTSHWGPFQVRWDGERLAVRPHAPDPDPSAIIQNIPDAAGHQSRVTQPMVRQGWLERGPGSTSGRGNEPFVPVSWERALDLVASELRRVREQHGNAAIYGGSYGWASAGRFHHAQSQIHRFLNCIGGFTSSVYTYSAGASAVILPRVFAPMAKARSAVTWASIVEHTELIVAFGGMAIKNSAVGSGGPGRHVVRPSLEAARARGARFTLVSPLADDLLASLDADWLPIRPNTDTALMLGLAHTLATEGLLDRDFLDRCCVGYPEFARYLLGETDGQPKSPEWAEAIAEIPAQTIRDLARRMASTRTLITVSHSLQRSQYGEQPVWMGLVLAAMLGQIGSEGGGYLYSLGSLAQVGNVAPTVHPPAFPQGQNPVKSYIPVARVADMLLHPGTAYDFDGERRTYPDIRLVYWVGGNPFHHHQDINRLKQAFARPETIVVHEPYWTATARHADVVFPSTISLERDDIAGSSEDAYVFAMQRAMPAFGQARDDYAIFAGLAERLGLGERFTEGRSADEWLRFIYDGLTRLLESVGTAAPTFEVFWAAGELKLPTPTDSEQWVRRFRDDPAGQPLPTPSGKIEVFSETIASFQYPDCPGHPAWLEPDEWLGGEAAQRFPLQMVSNQPSGRLHSQLDFGAASLETKVDGREPLRINPLDARARGIEDGSLVKVHNDRGALLAVARLTEKVRPGVIQMATGAWYDPVSLPGEPHGVCAAGNPNMVTRDIGTSRLAQGCTGQLCLVEVSPFAGESPAGHGYAPPSTVEG